MTLSPSARCIGSTARCVAAVVSIALLSGCTFHRSGSEALSFNPLKLWSDESALAAAHGDGYVHGERWNHR